MEDETKSLQCLETLVWDFLDLHGFMNGRKAEVTLPAALTIFLVKHNRKVQMKDIANTFNVSNSTVTDYVDYLESRGFVARVRSEEDRREVYIQLTEKGWDWVRRSRKLTQEYFNQRLSNLTPEERGQFIALMHKFLDVDKPSVGLRAEKPTE